MWVPPRSNEALRGLLVELLEFWAGIGECPPIHQMRLLWDVDTRRGIHVIRENEDPPPEFLEEEDVSEAFPEASED